MHVRGGSKNFPRVVQIQNSKCHSWVAERLPILPPRHPRFGQFLLNAAWFWKGSWDRGDLEAKGPLSLGPPPHVRCKTRVRSSSQRTHLRNSNCGGTDPPSHRVLFATSIPYRTRFTPLLQQICAQVFGRDLCCDHRFMKTISLLCSISKEKWLKINFFTHNSRPNPAKTFNFPLQNFSWFHHTTTPVGQSKSKSRFAGNLTTGLSCRSLSLWSFTHRSGFNKASFHDILSNVGPALHFHCQCSTCISFSKPRVFLRINERCRQSGKMHKICHKLLILLQKKIAVPTRLCWYDLIFFEMQVFCTFVTFAAVARRSWCVHYSALSDCAAIS